MVRQFLVVSEVAIAIILLIGCGLLLRSLQNIQKADLGFRTDHLLTLPINLPPARYPTDDKDLAFYRELYGRLNTSPVVQAVGRAQCLPLQGNECWWSPFSLEGHSLGNLDDLPTADFNSADEGYFRAMEIPIVRGRLFNNRDRPKSTPVALINEEMARRFWPDEDPIGKRLKPGYPSGHSELLTIVGIVGNAKRRSIEGAVHPEVYYDASQSPGGATLVIRTTLAPAALTDALRRTIHDLDPDMAVHDVHSMEYFVELATTPKRLPAILLTAFGLTALFLGAIGVYGLIAYLVSQRTHEIGIRMALGAQRTQVVNSIVKTGLRLAGPGIGIGLLAAFCLTRLMSSLLYAVSATDIRVFLGISLLMLVICLLASCILAWRTGRLDPMIALRYE